MKSKILVPMMLSAALFAGSAIAENVTHKPGEFRASKLSGVNVYNEAKEKIGDINDVILDKSGKVEHVIIGVGGFLGMGEHLVAVSFDKLKFVEEPASSTTASTANRPATNVDSNAKTAADGTRATTGTATTTTRTASTTNWYPDHAIFNATKDQLKAMPEFKY